MLRFSQSVASVLADSDRKIVVTGAGGWLGQATLEMLEQCLGEAFPARVLAFGSRPRALTLRSGRAVTCRALIDLAQVAAQPCTIAHYAFLTKDRIAEFSCESFVKQNEDIGEFVAAQARRLSAHSLFIPSSGAVYRADRIIENDLARNPYGAMKARDERRFLGLAQDLRVVVCRVFNLAGPYVNKVSTYALASILQDIERGGPIVLRADRPVVRSYVHVRDVIDLVFAVMLRKDAPPAPFDTAGEIEIEIGDLARRAAVVLGRPEMEIKRSALSIDLPADRYVGDGTEFHHLLKAQGMELTGLDAQISDTADYLRGLAQGA